MTFGGTVTSIPDSAVGSVGTGVVEPTFAIAAPAWPSAALNSSAV